MKDLTFISRAQAERKRGITRPRLALAIERGEVRIKRPGVRMVLVCDEDVLRIVNGDTTPASTQAA